MKHLLLASTLLTLCATPVHAQPVCSFVTFTQEWRDATANDYDSDDWRAFTKFTSVKTPRQIEGGLPDVARVVIHTTEQKWMLGVEFGSPPGTKCATHQIAQGMPHQLQTLPSLQVLPKGTTKPLHCHHAGQRYPAACTIPADSPLATLKADALIVSDAVAATPPTAYYWTQWDKRTKPDGSPVMVFRSTPLTVDIVMK